MAWFRRSTNQNNTGDYLQATDTVNRPAGIFSILLTGLLVAALVFGLYMGGKWLYNRINSSKNTTPTAITDTNNSNDSGNTSANGSPGNGSNNNSSNGTSNSGGTSANGGSSASGSNNPSNNSGPSSNSSSSVPNTSATPNGSSTIPSTGAVPESIPNTGPDPNYNY